MFAAVVLFVLGPVINQPHATLFDRVGSSIKTFHDPDSLVRGSAFGWTRKPMYLGFLLMLIDVGLALGSLAASAGPLLFFVAADRWYIPVEEWRMAATFGTDYDGYRASVRRWIGPRAT